MKLKIKPCPELDTFLTELSVSMTPLPERRRDCELEEMRHHIEEIADQKRRSGVLGTVAMRQAVAQMGDPGQIGCEIVSEWEQTVSATKLRLVKAIMGLGLLGGIVTEGLQIGDMYLDLIVMHHFQAPTAVTTAMDWNIYTLALSVIMSVIFFAVPAFLGIAISRKMPAESGPEQVLPASIYLGVCYMVLANVLRYIAPMLDKQMYPYFFNLQMAPILTLSLSAYAYRALKIYKLGSPDKSTWSLHVG